MRNPQLEENLPDVTIYCDPGLDRILYATWLLVAALVGAVAFVLWRVVR
jgi:hypothetical protein